MDHEIVSKEEWIRAQLEFQKRDLDYAKATDELSAARRRLPWLRVDKSYTFQGAGGLNLCPIYFRAEVS